MPLRIGFCSLWDASDPNAWSGYAFSMRQALTGAGCEIVDIGPLAPRPRPIDWARKALARGSGRFYHWDREPWHLETVARAVERGCRETRPDLLLAPSSLPLTRVEAGIPRAFVTDQVFPALLDGYVRPPAARYARLGLAQERAALAGASLASFPSAWAVGQAVRLCGGDPARILELPWGANLPAEPSDAEVERFLDRRAGSGPCALVFIGREWRRKGGDIVLATVRELERRGVACSLTLVGCRPPEPAPASATVIAALDKRDPGDAARFTALLAAAHFLFVPSRAEAYGQVFCEAAAFGLPVLATAVGGIPSIVKDGVTGLLLPPGSAAASFADAIEEALADRGRHAAMGRAARARYLECLNWRVFGARLAGALAALA